MRLRVGGADGRAIAVGPAPPGTVLAMVEGALITRLSPPLNLAGVETPWSSTVGAARARMAAAARQWRKHG